MPLTDPEGNAITTEDPRLPDPAETVKLHEAANRLEGLLAQATQDSALAPTVSIEAAVSALVKVFVPPSEDHPIRRVFQHHFEGERLRLLQSIAQSIDNARRGPALTIAQSVPQDLRGGILGT